ncbi:terpene synthase family protein [Streptomyces flavofungini]|uniref:terpene synthase family protein n=1 Tax=Streptomyces flavofungini TaxID=68200 RepID=UPI0025AF1378|nr:hypothetical protein [Streptomyces flavofungini]WJV50620.1 hypothetical protein QUY26_37045 [Streptomyces flavofungini]
MTLPYDELESLRIHPGAEHPLYRLPSRTEPDENRLDDLVGHWAEACGLLADATAHERLGDAAVADLIAHCYPGLRPDRAAPLAGWISWLFVIDDYYDRLNIRGEDHPDALTQEIIDALPVEPQSGIRHHDAPLARELARLWRHIAPQLSRWWRMRFATHVTHFLAAFRYERLHRQEGLPPGLPAYAELRRASSSVTACLDLLEYATGQEVPSLLHETRQLRTMFAKATDVVAWVNDVVSLKKEVGIGDTNNGIMVVRREFGLDLQGAIDHVYRGVARDVEEFLDAEAELWRVCKHWSGVTEAEQSALALLSDGMKAWMRGNLDWSVRANRYAA